MSRDPQYGHLASQLGSRMCIDLILQKIHLDGSLEGSDPILLEAPRPMLGNPFFTNFTYTSHFPTSHIIQKTIYLIKYINLPLL
jgi:hypothetical protein